LSSALLLAITLLIAGCSTSPRSENAGAGGKPDLSIQIASLDFSTFNRRLEKKDVAQLAKTIKREQIDVLAVRGLVRYPSVATRVDLLAELAAEADLQTAFGEMMNNSGRQTGNAVFSVYPILSSSTQPFEGVRSATMESALRATVDAGVRTISIVSAELPAKANEEDQSRCVQIIQSLDSDSPVITAGNLPSVVPAASGNASVVLPSNRPLPANAIWYTRAQLAPTSVRTVTTDIGMLLVARFDVYRRSPE
jgi:hypothetical protein